MSIPTENLSVDKTALFLDVDGTLLEIAEHPQDVAADAALIKRLQRLSVVLDGAMALISGRSITELERIFPGLRFAAAGEHGAEMRLSDAPLPQSRAEPMPPACLSALDAFADDNAGIVLERKAAGISLHYRQAPAAEAAARALVANLMEALGDKFRIIDGKMVLEIAPYGYSKGAAVRRFLDHAPFRQRLPVFIGDDITDEDGFEAVNALGGTSILVGRRPESAARHTLADVGEVHAWIDRTFISP